MNITITPFHINKSYNINSNNIAKTQSTPKERVDLPLPNYKNYVATISFGKKKTISIPAESFMLPKSAVPDEYQLAAANYLKHGAHTIVTAPTGTGKTAIAHYIIKKNFEDGHKTFYTTPLKALSNQKYEDLKTLLGKENIGILTGDRKENIHAPIVVMTTEIYHNMVTANYFGQHNDMLKNVKTVVFDEFHFMGDPSRGHVWEESIMFTPRETQILALSATVGNNTKIEKWIKGITGKQTKLVDVPIEARHVPLRFSYLIDGKLAEAEKAEFDIKALETAYYQDKLLDKQVKVLRLLTDAMGYKSNGKGQYRAISVLVDKFGRKKVSEQSVVNFLTNELDINQEAASLIVNTLSIKKSENKQSASSRVTNRITKQPEPRVVLNLITQLNKEDKLPAIVFVFSKKYANLLLKSSGISGDDLTSAEEKREIRKHIEKYKTEYGLYTNNLNEKALLKGYAIHSAAVLPLQKQLIEELFNKRLIKVAYATETLAAGINMPAKTVVMTDYRKPSGETKIVNGKKDFFRGLMANEFHQMTGRAGRRGIDTVGHVVLMAQDEVARAAFEELRLSKANNIESAYKTDAASVTGFLLNSTDISRMRHILQNSFFASLNNETSDAKLDTHMRTVNNYLSLLTQFGFVEKTDDGHRLTPAGHLVNDIKGKPQIPIVKALLDKKFQHLTPVELAGLISAMVVQQRTETFPIPPLPVFANTDTSDNELNALNSKIDDKLQNDLNIHSVNSGNTNAQILAALRKQYGKSLDSDITNLKNYLVSLKKDISQEEFAMKKDRNYSITNNFRTLNKLKEKEKEVKANITLLKRVEFLKDLLEQRATIIMSRPTNLGDDFSIRNDAYNELATAFNEYNSAASKLSYNMPKADLNPLAFNLVYKWATLNRTSSDHKANWDAMCRLLNDVGDVKYEGDLFNAIAQTIDFIHQIEDAVIHAQAIKGLARETQNFATLKSNLKEAVNLLKQPPLYCEEELK